MPGISEIVAHVIVAEIGVDMTRFPTAAHLASSASLRPRNDQSADKRRPTRVRQGAPWLKTILVTVVWAGARPKGSSLHSVLRLKARRGAKKPLPAVAASVLGACCYMLRDGVPYRDLGVDHFARRDKAKTIGRLVQRLPDLGLRGRRQTFVKPPSRRSSTPGPVASVQ